MTTAPRSSLSLAILLLAILVVLWGGNYTWVKIAVRDIGPWMFNALRYSAAAALLAVGLSATLGWRSMVPAPGERAMLALIGLLQAAVTTGATAIALQWVEASRVVLIVYSMPVWTLPLSLVLLGERPTAMAVIGALLGFGGIALLTNPLAMAWTAETLPGVVLALVGVLGWALGAVLYRKRVWATGFWPQTFWQIAVTAVAFIPLAIALEHDHAIRWTPPMIAVLVYNMILPTAFGFWCWSMALARMSATAAGQILLLSPLFGMVQSHLVLGEPLGAWVWASALAIVAGAWLTLRARSG